MTQAEKQMMKKMGLFAIIMSVLSLYLALLFNRLLHGGGVSYNPLVLLADIATYGFPFSIFGVILLLAGLATVYMYFHLKKEMAGMDARGRLFRMSVKRKTYGDAHFETPDEYDTVAIVQKPADAYGTILGQIDDSGKHVINYRMDSKNRANQHIAIVGSSGSGKTFTFSKPYCYQVTKRRESIILTDPDGGLYRDMAGYFEDKGYVVRRFDLKNLRKSDGWDVLRTINNDEGEDVELLAQLVAQIIITNLVEDTSSIYATGPMSLLKALILRVVLGHDYPPEKKNIESVYELLQNPAGEDFLDTVFDADTLSEEEKPCLGPYLAFKQGSPNLRGNLVTNLTVQLQLLQNKTVCKVLSTDDIDLLLPAKQPCAYFCLFPDDHDTYKFIVSLFFSMLFIKIINFADNQPNGRCPIPVNFLMDEFPSIGKIPDFDKKMATIRKRAMNVAMIFQDITQLQHNYEDTWVTLLANCSTFLSLGINDEFTSDMVTKRIGETTVEVQTERHDAVESIFRVFHATSKGEGKRSLLSYDELFRLGVNDCIILFQNHNPIFATKYPHILHPDSKLLRPILPKDIPDINNTEARKKRREAEKVRVEKYLEEHPLDEVDRSYANVCEPEVAPNLMDSIKRIASESMHQTLERMNQEPETMECDSEEEFEIMEADEETFFTVDDAEEAMETDPMSAEEPIEIEEVAPTDIEVNTSAENADDMKEVTQAEVGIDAPAEETESPVAEADIPKDPPAEDKDAFIQEEFGSLLNEPDGEIPWDNDIPDTDAKPAEKPQDDSNENPAKRAGPPMTKPVKKGSYKPARQVESSGRGETTSHTLPPKKKKP